MNRIRPWLYIGKYRETLDRALLVSHGITAMLLLAELVEHPGITSSYVAVDDGVPLSHDALKEGGDFVVEQHERGETVLVACGAGISRSATYAIAALKEIEGLPLREAFRDVKEAHPDAFPHKALWDSLCDYYGESVSWVELIHRSDL